MPSKSVSVDKMIGKKLSDCRIEERIKQAGFSTVYRARDVRRGRDVALKLISSEVAAKRSLMRQVRKEVRICMRLEHENIVKVHSFTNAKPKPYTIMEYFPSRDLKSLVLNDLDEARQHANEIATQMTRALAYLHRKGIIHCDIKANNVLVSPEWKVKIIDFALARLAAWTWIPLFRKREGTLEYLSPEQVKRGRLTKQTDVYALGATMYEMISGKPPHVGHDPKRVMEGILYLDAMSLCDIEKTVNPMFDSLVMSMLAKDKKNRPADAEAVLVRLTQTPVFLDADQRIL